MAMKTIILLLIIAVGSIIGADELEYNAKNRLQELPGKPDLNSGKPDLNSEVMIDHLSQDSENVQNLKPKQKYDVVDVDYSGKPEIHSRNKECKEAEQIMKPKETETTINYTKADAVVLLCQSNFTSINGGCYYFGSEYIRNWHVALNKCRSLDSRSSLISLESQVEWYHIKKYLTQFKLDKKNWWLGGSYEASEGSWKWTAPNRPVEISSWCIGEPNNRAATEDCMMIVGISERFNPQKRLCWNDFPCDGQPMMLLPMHFICKINV